MDLSSYTIYMKNIRRVLHQIPELAYEEKSTQLMIANYIQNNGFILRRVGTGLIVDTNPGLKRTIAFRADMDGLRLTEENDLPFKSKNQGIMHACGHDGHMAILLGLAKYIADNKIDDVNVRMIFQPAEEGEGGAVNMIEGGALNGVQKIYAIHLAPDIESGKIGICHGVNMAGTVEFDIDIAGAASHVANYHEGIDALKAMFEIVSRIYILAEDIANDDMRLHIGACSSGTSRNIVASSASVKLTFRHFDSEKAKQVMEIVKRLVSSVDSEFRTKSTVKIISEYIPVRNSEVCVKDIEVVGGSDVIAISKKYTAEDFAFYSDVLDGAIMWLGVNSGENTGLHTPRFNFKEECLEKGLEIYIKLLNKFILSSDGGQN